jgi:hypothetical protein
VQLAKHMAFRALLRSFYHGAREERTCTALIGPEEQRSRFLGPLAVVPHGCGGNGGSDARNGISLCWRREIPPFAKAAKDGPPTACGCVGGVKSHPLQKRQRMGHPGKAIAPMDSGSVWLNETGLSGPQAQGPFGPTRKLCPFTPKRARTGPETLARLRSSG